MRKNMRKKLRNKIREIYDTQDKCAYVLRIDNSALSRIVNCTRDPTGSQVKKLCSALKLTKKEILEVEMP